MNKVNLNDIELAKLTFDGNNLLYDNKPLMLQINDADRCYFNNKFSPIINIILNKDELSNKIHDVFVKIDSLIKTDNKCKYVELLKTFTNKIGEEVEFIKVKLSGNSKIYDENKKILDKPDYINKSMSFVISFSPLFKVSKQYGISIRCMQVLLKERKQFDYACLFD